MNTEIKKMTMRELTRELDRHSFGLKTENRIIADLMTEIFERMNKRSLAYIDGERYDWDKRKYVPNKKHLGVSCYTHQDYPDEVWADMLEVYTDYEDMRKNDKEEFGHSLSCPNLPAGWMVVREYCDPSSCTRSWYIMRNCDWLFATGAYN